MSKNGKDNCECKGEIKCNGDCNYSHNWEELVEYLATNHCITSTRKLKSKDEDEWKRNKEEVWNEFLTEQDADSRKTSRNVFVLGAGASYAVNKDLFPLGGDAVNYILKRFNYDEICDSEDHKIKKGSKDYFLWKKAQRLRSKMILRAVNTDQTFETQLSLLSHFVPVAEIREAISLLFGYRTYPNMFNEVLSYLLKSRFIDGIVNFNFDEILDQVIEEEVGQGQLLKVVSDGDIPQYSNVLQSQRLKIPFYIKPHGTFSSRSSLRFTKEHYLDIPEEIESFLKALFTGYAPNINEQLGNQFQVLNLIVIGFNLESLEFNNVISETAEDLLEMNNSKGNELNIYYVEYKSLLTEESESSSLSYKEKQDVIRKRIYGLNEPKGKSIGIKIIDLDKLQNLGVLSSNGMPSIDDFIKQIYCDVFNRFGAYRPKYIGRQLALLSYFEEALKRVEADPIIGLSEAFVSPLIDEKGKKDEVAKKFNDLKEEVYFNTANYFLERTIFEILVTTFKNNGYIQLLESLKKENRVGKYYHLYYDKTKGESHYTIHDILHCLSFKSNDVSFNYDLYHFEMSGNFISSANKLCKSIEELEKTKLKKNNFKTLLNKVVLPCVSRFKKAYSQEVLDEIKIKDIGKDFKVLGDRLMNSASINLHPDYKDYKLNYFGLIEASDIVPTYTSLKREIHVMSSKEILKTWTHVFVVIDRETYFNCKGLEGKKICLIESVSSLNKVYDNPPSSSQIHLQKMPYYDHHRHMYLYMNEDAAGELQPVKAIYYYKKGFSNNVNAICLEAGEDTKNNFQFLMRQFIGYYASALYYQKHSKLPNIGSNEALKKLLTEKEELKSNEYTKLFNNYLSINDEIVYQKIN